MAFRVNLQWRVLVLMTGGMALVLGVSAYLNDISTQALVEEDRYTSAVNQTEAIAERIDTQRLLNKPTELQNELVGTLRARPEFKQIDVFRSVPGGWELAATTNPAAPRLPRIDETTPDNEFGEKNQTAISTLWTMEDELGPSHARHWKLSKAIKKGGETIFVSTLVLKNAGRTGEFVANLRWENDLVLVSVIVASAAFSGFMIYHFFRRPARDILQAMSSARGGNFASRARVRRPDELGEIAGRFNELIDRKSVV